MLKRGAVAYTTATGMKTSQIKNLIGGMVTNLRAARAARTLNNSVPRPLQTNNMNLPHWVAKASHVFEPRTVTGSEQFLFTLSSHDLIYIVNY